MVVESGGCHHHLGGLGVQKNVVAAEGGQEGGTDDPVSARGEIGCAKG